MLKLASRLLSRSATSQWRHVMNTKFQQISGYSTRADSIFAAQLKFVYKILLLILVVKFRLFVGSFKKRR